MINIQTNCLTLLQESHHELREVVNMLEGGKEANTIATVCECGTSC